MTKIERFTQDEVKRDLLAQALPVVIEALEALKDDLEKGHENAGVAMPDAGNAYFQQIVGARYLITKIPELVKPIKQIDPPIPRKQFAEGDKEKAREYLEKRKNK